MDEEKDRTEDVKRELFVRIGDVNGQLTIIDGESFDPSQFLKSVKSALANHQFTSAEEKHKFVLKICKAFGLATDSILAEDPNCEESVINQAEIQIKSLSEPPFEPKVNIVYSDEEPFGSDETDQ